MDKHTTWKCGSDVFVFDNPTCGHVSNLQKLADIKLRRTVFEELHKDKKKLPPYPNDISFDKLRLYQARVEIDDLKESNDRQLYTLVELRSQIKTLSICISITALGFIIAAIL